MDETQYLEYALCVVGRYSRWSEVAQAKAKSMSKALTKKRTRKVGKGAVKARGRTK